jgi:hypothetical protein
MEQDWTAVTYLTCIKEVPSLNPDWAPAILNEHFLWISSIPKGKVLEC